MSNINQLAQASIPVYNAQVPGEGPKCIPLRIDFTVDANYDIDGKQLVDLAFISMVQTIFIDTTGNTTVMTVTIAGTNQIITAKPNTQGYYPVVCPNPFRMTFHCTTGVVTSVILCNVPIAPGQWATA